MENIKLVKLGDVCHINMGQSPDSATYNQDRVGIPFYQGNADFGELNPITRYWCSAPTKIANPNDILFSVRAPIGAINVATERCCIGRGLAALTANEQLCSLHYLRYALCAKCDSIIEQGTGSTFKAVNKAVLTETEIPLPPLSEQQKIANELDRVSGLITKRKNQIEKLELLVKAKFVEMFGDPVTNPMGWEVRALSETSKILTGNTPPRNDESNYGSHIEWIKTDNITDQMFLTPANEYLSEHGYKIGKHVEQGSILMACIAGSVKSIGRVAVADRKVAFNQQINAIMPLSYSTLFLYQLFCQTQGYLQSTINMSLKGILSKGKLGQLEFVLPPLPLQTKFADFVQKTEQTKTTMQKSLAGLEMLYKARMQKYFE